MSKTLPEKILIIEDNPGDAYYTRHLLQEEGIGHTYEIIQDGEDAWDYLQRAANGQSEMPDLVFLDLHLPKVNGFELLKKIRADQQLCKLPIIVLTISKETKDFIDSMVNGVEYYSVKPLTKPEIRSILKAMGISLKKAT